MAGRAAARIAPLVVLAGYALRPFVGSYTDGDDVAWAASGAPGRWVVSSGLVVLGFGGLIVAVHWAASLVGDEVQRPWTAVLAPSAMSIGAVLLAFQLGAVAAATAGAAEAGADPVAVLEEIGSWEGPLIGLTILSFALAWGGLAHAVTVSGALARTEARAFVGTMALAAGGLLIPNSVGEYVSVAGLSAGFWLLAGRLSLGDR